MQLTAEQKKKVLRERARALAQRVEKESEEGFLAVLEFRLAHESYAFELRHIRQVLPLRDLTPLPGVPPFILGVIHLRGEVLSVMDLKRFFELPLKGLTDLNRVIILESRTMAFGVLADVIVGVRRFLPGLIQPALPTVTGIRADYLKGVSGDGVIILDAERVLADEKNLVQ